MKALKIRTYGNENLSRAIQERLFELGYGWTLNGTLVTHTKEPFLYAEEDGSIQHDDNMALFDRYHVNEVTINELFEMTPKKRETIKVGDAEYDKADFESAVKDLKQIN